MYTKSHHHENWFDHSSQMTNGKEREREEGQKKKEEAKTFNFWLFIHSNIYVHKFICQYVIRSHSPWSMHCYCGSYIEYSIALHYLHKIGNYENWKRIWIIYYGKSHIDNIKISYATVPAPAAPSTFTLNIIEWNFYFGIIWKYGRSEWQFRDFFSTINNHIQLIHASKVLAHVSEFIYCASLRKSWKNSKKERK